MGFIANASRVATLGRHVCTAAVLFLAARLTPAAPPADAAARVAVNVFAPYWLDSDIMTPSLPMTSASPERSAGANLTSATSRTKMGVLLRVATTA